MLLLALLACGGTTVATPQGPLGASGPLPRAADAPPPPDALDTHRAVAEVCGWPDGAQQPAVVAITWRTFPAGEDRHLVDYTVELTHPSPALQVALAPVHPEPAGLSLTPGAPWIAVAPVRFTCHRAARIGCRQMAYDGVDLVQIVADGTTL